MLNIFFLTHADSSLVEGNPRIANGVKLALAADASVNLNCSMQDADAIILEEDTSYKNFNYVKKLKSDPIVQKYANKIFSINTDDSGTGLIKGIHISLHKNRFNPKLHAMIPYFFITNELALAKQPAKISPKYLATWRGNISSNKLRNKLVKKYQNDAAFDIGITNSWFNHNIKEKQLYIDNLNNAKFSLCPAGLSPATIRLYESMALGLCPVIISSEFIPPLGPDWDSFAIVIPENKISDMKKILEKRETSYKDLGEKANENWQKYFSPANVGKYYATQLLNIIRSSEKSNVQDEFDRWDSFRMYYTNNWTLPQRTLHKLKSYIGM